MAITNTTVATDNIQTLDNLPNDVQGLSAEVLKQRFDKYSLENNAYINDVLIPGIVAADSALQAQIDTNFDDIDALEVRATTNETNITGLGNTKANKSETYTKIEIDAIDAVNDNNLITHKSSNDHDGRYYTKEQTTTNIDAMGILKVDKTTYDAQIINAGSSNSEVVDARGIYPKMKNRLDAVDAQLAEKAAQIDLGSKSNLPTTDKTSFEKAIIELYNLLLTKLSKTQIQSLIGFADINKNLSLIDSTMLTTELLAMIAGTAGVNVTPALLSVVTGMLAELSVTANKTDFLKINNLINKANTNLGQFMNSSGVLSANASYNVSDYIPCDNSTTYTVNYHRLTAFYDINKTFMSVFDSTTGITGVQTITIPAGAKFLRTDIVIANGVYDNYYIYPTNAKYDLTILTGNKAIKDTVIQTVNANYLTKNLITMNDVELGLFLQNDGSSVVNALYDISGFIEVVEKAIYTVSMHRRTVFYNASKVVIGYLDTAIVYTDTDITMPIGCKYIKTAIADSKLATYYIFSKSIRQLLIGNGDTVPLIFKDYAQGVSKWYNKTFVSLGTSITAQDGVAYSQGDIGAIAKGYQTVIKDKLNFASYLNMGVSGKPMANGTGAGDGTNATGKTVNYSTYDLVIIEAGTNDFKLNVALGTKGLIGDTVFNTNTFYGAYRDLIEYILTNKPTARIVLFTPLQRDNASYDVNYTNSAGHKLIDYVNAIKDVGEMYGIPICDLYRNSGITKLTLATYLMDGLHPNDVGYARMGDYASSFIDNI